VVEQEQKPITLDQALNKVNASTAQKAVIDDYLGRVEAQVVTLLLALEGWKSNPHPLLAEAIFTSGSMVLNAFLEQRKARGILSDPTNQALIAFASGLLSGSGPSPVPRSFGQNLGQAGMQALNAYSAAQDTNQKRQLQQAQLGLLQQNLRTAQEVSKAQATRTGWRLLALALLRADTQERPRS
jgi:hypothetical protein